MYLKGERKKSRLYSSLSKEYKRFQANFNTLPYFLPNQFHGRPSFQKETTESLKSFDIKKKTISRRVSNYEIEIRNLRVPTSQQPVS